MPHRILCLLALAPLLAACGGSKNEPTAAATATASPSPSPTATPTPIIEKVRGTPTPLPEVTPSGKREPKIAAKKGEPPAGLVIRDLEQGTGAEAVPGKTLAVDYKGVHFDDGEPFDSSWSTGQPFQFILGARQVIKGWDQGIEGMRVGGRRELVIPPELAYGDHGQGSIEPDETIVFVIDLLDVT
jgi:peptidylprolyl isomerase